MTVSTHSRPKAAGLNKSLFFQLFQFQHTAARRRLDTHIEAKHRHEGFQHTAARRRLGRRDLDNMHASMFQHTAARRRLVGFNAGGSVFKPVSTHSRPKAAGFCRPSVRAVVNVSTHSRPKAAGQCRADGSIHADSFNTQPPEGGWRSAPLLHQAR